MYKTNRNNGAVNSAGTASINEFFTVHLTLDSNLDKGVKDNHVVISVQYFHLIKIEESTMWVSKE